MRPRHLGRTVCFTIILCGHASGQLEPQIEQHFAAAKAAQSAGDLAGAAREYEAILNIRPDFAEIHMNLGLVLHAQGKFDDSARALAHSLKLKPELFAAALFQGINYCKLGRHADAVPLLKRAAAREPANKQVRFWLGSALAASGQLRAALLELESASQSLPGDIDILQLLGETYQRAAQAESERIKALAPDSRERRLMVGEGFLAQQEWLAAEIYYKKLLQENVRGPGVHLGMGTALLRQGKLEPAIKQLEEELRIDRYSVEAHCGLAEILSRSGNTQEASEHLRAAFAIHAEQAAACAQSADAGLGELARQLHPPPSPQTAAHELSREGSLELVRQRRYDAAIAGLLQHLNHHPQDLEAREALARCYLEVRRPAEAVRELRRVLKSAPGRATARIWLARSYRDLALKAFENIVELQPDSYRAHQLLGEAYEWRKQDDKALAEYRAALAAKPDLPGLRAMIGRIHLRNMRLEDAAIEFQKELEINPFDADANTDLGGIYVNAGQPEKAIPLLEQAVRVKPDLMEARRRLGKAYFNTGQYPKAAEQLLRAASADDDGSTHYLLARTYRQLGKAREAENALRTVTRIKAARLKEAQDRAERVRQLDW